MRIICITNQKGGVGKTTTAMNFAHALSKKEHRVLAIDCDPQANLTSYLGVFEEEKSEAKTIDELFLAKKPLQSLKDAQSYIIKTDCGVDLVASDRALSGVEFYLFSRPDKERVLSKFLNLLKNEYDFVLIDTPPSINLLTLNALVAATGVIVPVQPEYFSLEGIVKIRQTIADVQTQFNPDLKLYGVLATQVNDRRKLTEEVLGALSAELGEQLFETRIHENAAIAESSGQARSIFEYQKNSRGAEDYKNACDELISKML